MFTGGSSEWFAAQGGFGVSVLVKWSLTVTPFVCCGVMCAPMVCDGRIKTVARGEVRHCGQSSVWAGRTERTFNQSGLHTY